MGLRAHPPSLWAGAGQQRNEIRWLRSERLRGPSKRMSGKKLPKALSPSAAQAYQQCPRKFYWGKVERIREPATEATAKGRIIHTGLELLFDLPRHQRDIDSLWSLVTKAWEDAKADPDYAEVVGAEGFDEEKFLASVREACEKYFKLERPWRFDPDEREMELGATVEGVRLFGIVDRFDRASDGLRYITDYKSGRVPAPAYREKAFFQLLVYAALVEKVKGEKIDRLRLVYLGDPHGVVALDATDSRVRKVMGQVAHIWADIETAFDADDWPTKTSKLCDWCWYQDFCPAFATWDEAKAAAERKGVPVEILSPDEYQRRRRPAA